MASTTAVGRKLLDASMIVASTALHMQNCIATRLMRGVARCDALSNFDYCEMWIWLPPHAKTTPYTYTSEADDCKRPINLRKLIEDLPGVTQDNWEQACVIQFWCVTAEDAGSVTELYPDINLLGGNGASSAPIKREGDDQPGIPGKRRPAGQETTVVAPQGTTQVSRRPASHGTTVVAPQGTTQVSHTAGPHNPRRRGRNGQVPVGDGRDPLPIITTNSSQPPPPAPPPAPAIAIPSLQIGVPATYYRRIRL